MSLFKKMGGRGTTVGLDIGNHTLKIVKLRHQKDGYFLEATGIKDLPKGTIEGGEIKKRDALIDAITHLVNQCDPSIREIVFSLGGHGIISDKITFKIEDDDNAEELILWEASQRSPFDVDDITLDYKILRRFPGTRETEVLLVAAKNQVLQSYLDLIYDAALVPVIVDVDAFAITNSYALECAGLPDMGTIALLNIGHSTTSITFIKDGIYHSSRDISTSGELFNRIIQRNLGVSSEEAAAAVRGKASGTVDMNQLKQSVSLAAEELSSGIDVAFSYYKGSENTDSIDKIVLSGGGAYIPTLAQFLESRHQTKVQISNPLAHVQYNKNLFGNTNVESIGALLTVAVGLALRKTGE
ncbi:MAG: pilus assembly protein PilM [Chitinispirillales bacterium]|jgi:type IV pilus assembly protein PilM|nr:pilus assembly protein PilM [Chitinispirillales bacterium]